MKTVLSAILASAIALSAFAEEALNASVTLRDSSVIKGTVAQDIALEGAVVFADTVKIPLSLVRDMAADGTLVISAPDVTVPATLDANTTVVFRLAESADAEAVATFGPVSGTSEARTPAFSVNITDVTGKKLSIYADLITGDNN